MVQDSEDIHMMVGALKTLGIKLEEDWPNSRIVVEVRCHCRGEQAW